MRLYCEVWGEELPLLILYRFLGSGYDCRTMARSLGIVARHYLIDLRNHGRRLHAPDHTYSAMADDILELLDAQSLSEAVILGHSMRAEWACSQS